MEYTSPLWRLQIRENAIVFYQADGFDRPLMARVVGVTIIDDELCCKIISSSMSWSLGHHAPTWTIPLSQIIEAFQVLYYEFGSINGNLFPILDRGRPASALPQPTTTNGCVSRNSDVK